MAKRLPRQRRWFQGLPAIACTATSGIYQIGFGKDLTVGTRQMCMDTFKGANDF
jgi:hypothetical protein